MSKKMKRYESKEVAKKRRGEKPYHSRSSFSFSYSGMTYTNTDFYDSDGDLVASDERLDVCLDDFLPGLSNFF